MYLRLKSFFSTSTCSHTAQRVFSVVLNQVKPRLLVIYKQLSQLNPNYSRNSNSRDKNRRFLSFFHSLSIFNTTRRALGVQRVFLRGIKSLEKHRFPQKPIFYKIN